MGREGGKDQHVSSSQSYELQTEAEIKSRTQLLSCNCILEEEVKKQILAKVSVNKCRAIKENTLIFCAFGF